MKKKLLLFISFVSIVFPTIISSTVILTHGAYGDDANWYKPGGDFYDALKISGKKIGQDIISFKWTQFLGGITHKERLNAARELAKLIVDLTVKEDSKIIIIAHSYGGHVAKAASQILAVALGFQHVDRPIVSINKNLNKVKVPYDWDQKYYEQICDDIKIYMQEKILNDKTKNVKKFLIDALYTLGTPNDIDDYESHMDVIQFLFNFYSEGDFVQDLVGNRKLLDPRHKRAVNLDIRLKGSGWFGLWGKPNHLQMHAQEIAKWILYIPFYLMDEKYTGFKSFTFKQDGLIYFGANRFPKYSYTKKHIRKFISSFSCMKNKIPFLNA